MPVFTEPFVKQPSEETTRDVDFSLLAEILAGETIADHTVAVTFNDEVQEDMLVSSALDGNKVAFRVQGGTDGNTYKITTTITTDAGHVREADIFMKVVEY